MPMRTKFLNDLKQLCVTLRERSLDYWGFMINENSSDFYAKSVKQALGKFGIGEEAEVSLIKHRENAVYSVETPTHKSVLRMHRPGYRTAAELWSEAEWTMSLSSVGVDTPHHILGVDGQPVQRVSSPHTDQLILCDLLEWVEGHEPSGVELEKTFSEVGRLSALIHSHGVSWAKPQGFVRPRLDEEHLFGPQGVWGDFNQLEALTSDQRNLLVRLSIKIREDLSGFEKTSATWGLIHGDLMPENILQTPNGAVVIDFDDGGFGWFVCDLATSLGVYLGTPDFDRLMEAWVEGYATVTDPDKIGLEFLPALIGARLLQALGWVHTRKGNDTAMTMTGFLIGAGCSFADDYLASAN
jgi:Ser/Thr protein kinase RdoA (MazF antagonist)